MTKMVTIRDTSLFIKAAEYVLEFTTDDGETRWVSECDINDFHRVMDISTSTEYSRAYIFKDEVLMARITQHIITCLGYNAKAVLLFNTDDAVDELSKI